MPLFVLFLFSYNICFIRFSSSMSVTNLEFEDSKKSTVLFLENFLWNVLVDFRA